MVCSVGGTVFLLLTLFLACACGYWYVCADSIGTTEYAVGVEGFNGIKIPDLYFWIEGADGDVIGESRGGRCTVHSDVGNRVGGLRGEGWITRWVVKPFKAKREGGEHDVVMHV